MGKRKRKNAIHFGHLLKVCIVAVKEIVGRDDVLLAVQLPVVKRLLVDFVHLLIVF